ncbi:MAG: histidine kinase, partial [Clostridia bacterium]|nr:histidine kinase [Clostridia bacterium]
VFFSSLKDRGGVVVTKKLKGSDYVIAEVINNDIFMSEINQIKSWMIIINFILIIIFFGIILIIVKNITNPIKDLSEKSVEVAGGNLDAKVVVNGHDEIAKLGQNFNKMTSQLKSSVEKINETEKSKRELELQMLYAQINPHFLFNTLNSIRWMAQTSKVYNVSNIIVALAELLKSSIIERNEYITIEEEINNVKNYITIQRLRFSSVFECEYNISQEILQCKTLKLILQPIVENTIIHGFEGIHHKGIIKITGYKENNKIILIISDNGKGMTQEEQTNIMAEPKQKNKKGLSGIGISNVHKRIILHFGDDFGLQITSEHQIGTTTILSLPIIIDNA